MNYRIFIVDDEAINLTIVKRIVSSSFAKTTIVGQATNIEDMVEGVNNLRPDILILDINLGNREVFEGLEIIGYTPQIVFVSSQDNYAIEAFKFNAVDFVLKPIQQDRLVSAISKAIRRLELENNHYQFTEVSKNISANSRFITVSSIDKHEIVRLNEIMYVKAEGRCVSFHLKDGKKVYSYKNLMEYNFLYEKNPFFIKVNRSYIINFEHVIKVIKKVGVYCELINGIMIPVSRRKIPDFNRFITSHE